MCKVAGKYVEQKRRQTSTSTNLGSMPGCSARQKAVTLPSLLRSRLRCISVLRYLSSRFSARQKAVTLPSLLRSRLRCISVLRYLSSRFSAAHKVPNLCASFDDTGIRFSTLLVLYCHAALSNSLTAFTWTVPLQGTLLRALLSPLTTPGPTIGGPAQSPNCSCCDPLLIWGIPLMIECWLWACRD